VCSSDLHPELVQRVVLANTTAQYPDAAKSAWTQRIAAVQQGGMAAVADMVVERYFHAAFRESHPALAQGLREQLLRCDPAGYVACCYAAMAVDWLERLGEVKCPALVIAGTHDVGATPAMAQAIAQRIALARLVELEHASHLSVVEQPQAFLDAVTAFIAS